MVLPTAFIVKAIIRKPQDMSFTDRRTCVNLLTTASHVQPEWQVSVSCRGHGSELMHQSGRSKKEGAAAGLAPSPYTSIIPLIVLWCFLALLSFNLYGRIGSAVKMLRSARHLNRGFLHRLWYFVLMTFCM